MPTIVEMDALAELGFEGFNVYFAHLKPHLLDSRLRPMPAMADTSTEHDLKRMNALPGAIIEASITPFPDYGKPLDAADLEKYRAITAKSRAPVVAPSQKRFLSQDMARLKEAGIAGALLGVIVTGDSAATLYDAVAPITEAARHLCW